MAVPRSQRGGERAAVMYTLIQTAGSMVWIRMRGLRTCSRASMAWLRIILRVILLAQLQTFTIRPSDRLL
jgi:hypothetical protein